MSPRASLVLRSAPFALLLGCATTPPPPPTVAAADPEVVVLRDRVARLEHRLADVDGKLATLLLRAEGTPAAAGGSPFATPGPRYASIDLGHPADAIPVPEGLRSTDLGSRGGQDLPIDDDGSVVLRMRGDNSGAVEAVVEEEPASDDPLSTLTSAKDLYSWGQARLKEGRHIEALAAFEDVLGRFAKDPLADNAMYWIGVCHQARGDHKLAIEAWQRLPARFPRSPKVPDALFGMAQSHEASGEPALAEVLYDEIVASYPKAEKHADAVRALNRLRPRR
jgi:hypothetical protein